MRKRRSFDEMQAEQTPVMYSKSQIALREGVRSSFPSWRGSRPFDFRNGWTRLGDFFAEGYYLRDEMCELVRNRFGVSLR